MIRYSIYYVVVTFFLGFCFACNEDDDKGVCATDLDLDWFVVADDYDNPIDSLRYEIFKKYNVAVYYDDTIGCRDRGERDRMGNPILFYRVIDPKYTISGYRTTLSWEEVKTPEELRPVLGMLLNYTFDNYPVLLLPRCLYLVKNLDTQTGGIVPFLHTLESGVVNIDGRKNTREDGATLQSELGAAALQNFYEEEMNLLFYNVSRTIYASIYGKSLGEFITGEYGTPLGIYKEGDRPEKFGFLRFGQTRVGSMITPRMVDRDEDARDFIKLVQSKSLEVVKMEYEAYPFVIQKYEALKRIWDIASSR